MSMDFIVYHSENASNLHGKLELGINLYFKNRFDSNDKELALDCDNQFYLFLFNSILFSSISICVGAVKKDLF